MAKNQYHVTLKILAVKCGVCLSKINCVIDKIYLDMEEKSYIYTHIYRVGQK